MRYLEKTFSAPAGPSGISQREWDYATLSAAEFAAKYGCKACGRTDTHCHCIGGADDCCDHVTLSGWQQPNPDAHLGAVEP